MSLSRPDPDLDVVKVETIPLELEFQQAVANLTNVELCLPADRIAALILRNIGGRRKITRHYASCPAFEAAGVELPELLEDCFESRKPNFFLQYLDMELSPDLDTSFSPRELIIVTLSLQIADAFEKRVWPEDAENATVADIAARTRKRVAMRKHTVADIAARARRKAKDLLTNRFS